MIATLPQHRALASLPTIATIALLALASVAGSTVQAQTPPADFVQVRPQDIKWNPHPTVAGAQLAILLGDPAAEGPYAMRIRFAANTRVPPHTHPEARTYTVLAGEWKLGFGETFDAAQLRSYPAGSLYRLPADVVHYQASGATETIIQIQGRGPTATKLVVPPGDSE
ncbi:MAG: cupin domain-containing protein [Gemmatimonadaceae bacterium]